MYFKIISQEMDTHHFVLISIMAKLSSAHAGLHHGQGRHQRQLIAGRRHETAFHVKTSGTLMQGMWSVCSQLHSLFHA